MVNFFDIANVSDLEHEILTQISRMGSVNGFNLSTHIKRSYNHTLAILRRLMSESLIVKRRFGKEVRYSLNKGVRLMLEEKMKEVEGLKREGE